MQSEVMLTRQQAWWRLHLARCLSENSRLCSGHLLHLSSQMTQTAAESPEHWPLEHPPESPHCHLCCLWAWIQPVQRLSAEQAWRLLARWMGSCQKCAPCEPGALFLRYTCRCCRSVPPQTCWNAAVCWVGAVALAVLRLAVWLLARAEEAVQNGLNGRPNSGEDVVVAPIVQQKGGKAGTSNEDSDGFDPKLCAGRGLLSHRPASARSAN